MYYTNIPYTITVWIVLYLYVLHKNYEDQTTVRGASASDDGGWQVVWLGQMSGKGQEASWKVWKKSGAKEAWLLLASHWGQCSQ